MLYYEAILECRLKDRKKEENQEEKTAEHLKIINDSCNTKFKNGETLLAYCLEKDRIYVAIAHNRESDTREVFLSAIIAEIKKLPEIERVSFSSMREITAGEFRDSLSAAENGDLLPYSVRRNIRRMDWDYLDNCDFNLKEEILDDIPMDESTADKALDELMGDKSLREEIARIYDAENADSFYGYPVHYKIIAGNLGAAEEMARLTLKALFSRNRIPGKRLTTVYKFDDSRGGRLENLFKNSSGTAVLIELSASEDEEEYANSLERVWRRLVKLIEKYHDETLFFLFENTEKLGFSKELMSRIEDSVQLIELKEGRGNREEARTYLEKLVEGSKFQNYMDNDVYSYIEKKKCFHASDVQNAFEEWSKKCLREKVYKAYSNSSGKKRKKKIKPKRDAYKQLQDMTGLKEIKGVVDDILAFYRIQKIRGKYHIENRGISRHMVFTGNPGCAKTTVARLLSEILLEEGIISTGTFVECGRADLVGKYVGWTAKEVKALFKKAKGGILFIDEAYSLLDNSKSFGDEAINTIVQEMENHREDVTVIFAGYPEPMRDFLDRNEGLRSRIAFYLDFPDYNAEELVSILKYIAKDKGYTIAEDALSRCRAIFETARSQEGFGNGRYARNLLEHAIVKQSGRLSGKGCRKKPSLSSVMTLKAEDFDLKYMSEAETKKLRGIGFTL